jgi:uncharacterized CHY-type Zn-finger protein
VVITASFHCAQSLWRPRDASWLERSHAARNSLGNASRSSHSLSRNSFTTFFALCSRNDAMSLISSFIIDPVVRAGRRFSGAAAVPSAGDAAGLPLSHANHDPSSATTPPADSDVDASASAVPDATAAGNAPQISSASPVPLLDRIRRYSSFTRRPHDVVVDEEVGDDEGGLNSSVTAPIDIPVDAASMSSNPSRALEARFRGLDLETPVSSAPTVPTAIQGARPGTAGLNAGGMSESLPADDGFTHLRARIHEIRALEVTEQERAQMIHSLMIERYNHMRPTSPSSFVSNDRPFTPNSAHSVFSEIRASSSLSAASDVDVDNPYKLRPGDDSPTYRTIEHNDDEEDEDEHAEDELVLGCQHYKRNVKVQCYECRHWYTCRHCHDEVEDHPLNRKMTQNMLCMACGTPQKAGATCTNCSTEAACYYCDICKLWDNNSRKKIYHCPDCGICRRGEGLGKDYTHCQVSVRTLDRTRPFLILYSGVMSALPYLMRPLMYAFHVLQTLDVLFAPTTSSLPLQLWSQCHAGTTCINNAIHCTWKPRTSVQSARRVP